MTLLVALCRRLAAVGAIATLIAISSNPAIADEDTSDPDLTRYSEDGLPEYPVLNVLFKDVNQNQCFPTRGSAVRAGLSALHNEKTLNNGRGFFVTPCESQNSGSQGYSTGTQSNKQYSVVFPTNSSGSVINPSQINIVNAFSNLKTYPAGSVGFVHVHLNGLNHGWQPYDTGVMCGLSATVFLYRHDHVIERYSLPTGIDWTQTQATKTCSDEVRANNPVPTRLWKLLVDPSKINTYVDPGVSGEE